MKREVGMVMGVYISWLCSVRMNVRTCALSVICADLVLKLNLNFKAFLHYERCCICTVSVLLGTKEV
jgi:hypothetical protein